MKTKKTTERETLPAPRHESPSLRRLLPGDADAVLACLLAEDFILQLGALS